MRPSTFPLSFLAISFALALLVAPANGDPLEHCVNREMLAHAIPGLSMAIIQNGRIVSTRGYGATVAGGGTVITPESYFQAASISKVATAAAALIIVQQGKLSLDEDVNTYLRDWKVPENQFTRDQKVTIRRILSHTAGFSVHGFPGYPPGQALPALMDILNGAGGARTGPIRVESVPGSQWTYSGGGYTVLQKVMTDVTGQPFPALMNDLLLRPLAMSYSTFQQPLPGAWETEAAGRGHVYPEMAAAGLWTTPSDLARLFIAIQQGLAGRTGGVISPAIARQMTTPVMKGDGLGLFMSGTGNEFFGHDGRNAGFDALARCSATCGVVVMINANDNTGVLDRICAAAWTGAGLTPPLPAPKPPAR